MNASHVDLLDAINQRRAKVAVIGLGYVGLPLAASAVLKGGFNVLGFDIDPSKITVLEAGESYIDAVTDEELAQAHAAGLAAWTSDFARLAECQVIVICVPTPLNKHREPDLSAVRATTRSIAKHMAPGTLVVLESTTFPGTTAEVVVPLLEEAGHVNENSFWAAFSPEREDPGNARFNTRSIPKIVGGDSDAARSLVAAFYGYVVDSVVPVSSTRVAEATKITENIFRAVNIALVNELKVIFDAMDIDVWEVIDGAATKPFGYMPFYPGPGLGGHCIPIDPFYLTWKAREFGHTTRFIELAGEINVNMPGYVVSRLREVLDETAGKGLKGARILLVGIAYKKNVSDMRESPSVELLDLMENKGATVDFLDPRVAEIPSMREHPNLAGRRAVSPAALAGAGYDAILISTDHDDVDYAALADLGIPIVDTRNVMARLGLPMEHVTKA